MAEADKPDPNRSPLRVVDAYSALCDLDLLMSRYDEAIAPASQAMDAVNAASADLTPLPARLASGAAEKLGIPRTTLD